MLGNRLSLVSGHSRQAWQMARWMQARGLSVQMVTSGAKHSISSRHQDLIEREGYADLWNTRLEFGENRIQPANTEQRRQLAPIIEQADLVHVYDMRALRAVHRMFGGRVPAKLLMQVSSQPNLGWLDLWRAGSTAWLMTATRPDHLASVIVPRWYLRRLLNLADAVVCTSRYLADSLCGTSRLTSSGVHVVTLGVALADAHAQRLSDGPDFLYFGWPGAHRGTLDAAEALARFKQANSAARCLISTYAVGQGISEDVLLINKLKRRFAPRGLTVTDFMPDIRQRLVGAKAALLPFRSPFGYAQPPLVVLEAMAGGVPVISTDVGSVSEMITDGINGYLVRPGDIDAMVERMTRLWSDAGLQKRMSDAARATVAEKFRLESTFEKLLAVYGEVIRG